MTKLLFAALVAASAVFASFGAAQADEREGGCCGPIAPHYIYNDVARPVHVTRYRDVVRRHYVDRRELFVHVTRVHPVVYVDEVTRVHEQPIERVIPEYASRVVYLPLSQYASRRTIHIQEPCVCADCR